jgi:hypothetical protein
MLCASCAKYAMDTNTYSMCCCYTSLGYNLRRKASSPLMGFEPTTLCLRLKHLRAKLTGNQCPVDLEPLEIGRRVLYADRSQSVPSRGPDSIGSKSPAGDSFKKSSSTNRPAFVSFGFFSGGFSHRVLASRPVSFFFNLFCKLGRSAMRRTFFFVVVALGRS